MCVWFYFIFALCLDIFRRRTYKERPKCIGNLPEIFYDQQQKRQHFKQVQHAWTSQQFKVKCWHYIALEGNNLHFCVCAKNAEGKWVERLRPPRNRSYFNFLKLRTTPLKWFLRIIARASRPLSSNQSRAWYQQVQIIPAGTDFGNLPRTLWLPWFPCRNGNAQSRRNGAGSRTGVW